MFLFHIKTLILFNVLIKKVSHTNKEVHCEKVACSVCKGKGRYKVYSVVESIPYNWFEEPEEN